MSFWGATVITSLASALPIVGESIVSWLWGGFSVDNATLNRFFSLHYLLPFGLVALSGAHLAALHQYGSNNPIGVAGDKLMLYPYYFVKDFVGWLLFGLLLCLLVVYSPNALGHPDNYISANPRRLNQDQRGPVGCSRTVRTHGVRAVKPWISGPPRYPKVPRLLLP